VACSHHRRGDEADRTRVWPLVTVGNSLAQAKVRLRNPEDVHNSDVPRSVWDALYVAWWVDRGHGDWMTTFRPRGLKAPPLS